jgi:hypothetical protein
VRANLSSCLPTLCVDFLTSANMLWKQLDSPSNIIQHHPTSSNHWLDLTHLCPQHRSMGALSTGTPGGSNAFLPPLPSISIPSQSWITTSGTAAELLAYLYRKGTPRMEPRHVTGKLIGKVSTVSGCFYYWNVKGTSLVGSWNQIRKKKNIHRNNHPS